MKADTLRTFPSKSIVRYYRKPSLVGLLLGIGLAFPWASETIAAGIVPIEEITCFQYVGLPAPSSADCSDSSPPKEARPVQPFAVIEPAAEESLDARCLVYPYQEPSRAFVDCVWRTLRDRFERQIGLPFPFIPQPDRLISPYNVDVAVIDTVAGDVGATNPYQGQPGHGRSVGLVIHHEACPNATDPNDPCRTAVSYHQALCEGQRGSLDSLAGAICQAVESRKSDNLIINLSLGWRPADGFWSDPDWGILKVRSDSSLSPEELRVKKAIQFATCARALVIAAAGNRSTLNSVSKADDFPVLPAAWEREPAPSRDFCASLGLVGPRVEHLVYAVGGIDPAGRRLLGTPAFGLPRLLAPASQVVTWDGANSGPTEILTGTSMAAAVVSGAAAFVWSRLPEATASEVMNWLYATGAGNSETTGFCPYGPEQCATRVVSALDAFSLGRCELYDDCYSFPWPVGVEEGSYVQSIGTTFGAPAVSACAETVFVPAPGKSGTVCQPETPGCKACVIVIGGGGPGKGSGETAELYLAIHERSWELREITLHLFGENGKFQDVKLKTSLLRPGTVLVKKSITSFFPIQSAAVSFETCDSLRNCHPHLEQIDVVDQSPLAESR